jgi:hypothetical protein
MAPTFKYNPIYNLGQESICSRIRRLNLDSLFLGFFRAMLFVCEDFLIDPCVIGVNPAMANVLILPNESMIRSLWKTGPFNRRTSKDRKI